LAGFNKVYHYLTLFGRSYIIGPPFMRLSVQTQ